jgi:hypothetical protein
MENKFIRILVFTLLIQFHLIQGQYLLSKKIVAESLKSELNCLESPIHKNLEITTNLNENSDDYNIVIMKDCEISEKWRVKPDNQKQCVIPERVFEGEDNIRRSFRFTYHTSNVYKDKIVIKSVSVDYPKNIAETSLTKDSLTLYPGESIDIYLDYDCLDMDEKKKVSDNWFKLRIDLEFENKQFKSFEYTKICTASYSDKLDFSHIVIIAFVFLIVFASVKDYLKSKVEGIIVEKFTEIKNPENLLIISLVIGILLIFLGVVNMLSSWVYIAIMIVGPLSVAMITEAILRKNLVLLHLESKTYEIPYLGSITMFFLVCLGSGLFVLFLWLETHNWFINNIFSITISIISIRIFKFTSFKFMGSIFILAWMYEYFWFYNKSNYYSENFKLTNNPPENLPVNLLCPELLSSPFSACSSLPIADIILPGIFLMYSKKFDESKYIQNYFYAGVGAFGAGLLVNLIVYYSYLLPTPSFLFTAPFILIATLAIAYRRQELYEFIEGFSSTIYENKAENNLNNYFEQQRKNNQNPYNPPMKEMDNVDQDDEDELNNYKK